MDENCKTCAIYERGYCTIILEHKDSYCPCKKCIVKTMCENPCKEFNELVWNGPRNIKRAKRKES